MEKELLKKLGQETIYSAKGHFKACDLRRQLITLTIWGCIVLNLLSFFEMNGTLNKAISCLGLFGTIGLLIWNEGDGKNYRTKHKEAAEKYLALHKEIRSNFYLNELSSIQVEELSKKVSLFDQLEKPEIPSFARYLAKKAIEKQDPETDNWFL